MTVTLTDEQYGAMARTLTAIAYARRKNAQGNAQRITRDDLTTMAREACDAVGLDWQAEQRRHPEAR